MYRLYSFKWLFLLLSVLCFEQCKQVAPAPTKTIAETEIPELIDFNFHVRPILSDRCYTCHGPDEAARQGNFRLDTPEGAFQALGEKQDHFAIVAGQTAKSTLIHRIFSSDEEIVMPPPVSNLTLTEREKNILKKWIKQGATWKEHWSFIPPVKPNLPKVENKSWCQNEIDYFVLAKLENQQWQPSAKASKEQLLRRLYFDLTGLAPDIPAIEKHLNNNHPNAYEQLVDELLASDACAEHLAVQWLDIARYADTHGYQDDLERVMWPWRDWVIHAFKQNLPYDQFLKWQLAGDLLPKATKEQILATGFNRNHKITQEGGVIDEEYRVEYVMDRTQTFATAFLGLTMECARCHDHKYDPFSQEEFYSLYSFFNNVEEKGVIDYGEIPEPKIKLTQKEIDEVLTFINNVDTLKEIEVMVMAEQSKVRQAHILNRGSYDQPTKAVYPATPKAVLTFSEKLPQNRLGLAEWLIDPNHPLTARVAANRFWQQLFGKGLVATAFDFGNQGALPSHPALLDWLATEFEQDWDVKALIKTIALSTTYQQSSVLTPQLLEQDQENKWLARAPRLRLSAEMIRDHFLNISGLLVPEVGGPSVKPYQPKGLWQETTGGGGGSTAKYIEGKGNALYRRSMYTFWKRTVPPPSMITFDAASRDNCTVQRQSTSTPLQALVLMNDPQVIEACRVITYRAQESTNGEVNEMVRYIFQAATSRLPNEDELKTLVDFFHEEQTRFKQNEEAASQLIAIGDYPETEVLPIADLAAYTVVANTIFNLDETITKG